MTEIKNCPFCGSKPRIYHKGLERNDRDDYKTLRRYRTMWFIDCGICGSASVKSGITEYIFDNDGKFYIDGDYDGRQDVISRWNERA